MAPITLLLNQQNVDYLKLFYVEAAAGRHAASLCYLYRDTHTVLWHDSRLQAINMITAF